MASTFIIWNPCSGRAADADGLRRWLGSRPDHVVRESGSAEEAVQMARDAATEGFEVIVAAGGDGTVSSVANGVQEGRGEAAMAVLPTGTANDFASSLAIPDDLDAAAALIASGQRRAIDLIELKTDHQQQCFVNVATGGNSDRVTELLTDELKQRWGPLCYLRGAMEVLTDLKSFHVKVSLEDEPPFDVQVWNVIIANGRTNAGRLPVAPRANLEDGLVDLILIRNGEWSDVAEVGTKFALGDYLNSDQVIYRQTPSLTISSDPPMRYSVDGEPIPRQPVSFRALPRALRVVVGDDYLIEPPVT